jgi:hypothetical protein
MTNTSPAAISMIAAYILLHQLWTTTTTDSDSAATSTPTTAADASTPTAEVEAGTPTATRTTDVGTSTATMATSDASTSTDAGTADAGTSTATMAATMATAAEFTSVTFAWDFRNSVTGAVEVLRRDGLRVSSYMLNFKGMAERVLAEAKALCTAAGLPDPRIDSVSVHGSTHNKDMKMQEALYRVCNHVLRAGEIDINLRFLEHGEVEVSMTRAHAHVTSS